MHPVGASWVDDHHDAASHGASACRTCPGLDYKGTVLSRAFSQRSIRTEYGTVTLAAGTQVGCYNCHNGPSGEGRPPVPGPTPTPTPRRTPTPTPTPRIPGPVDDGGHTDIVRRPG